MGIRHEILNGPERSTIFTAFEHVYDKDVQVTMRFTAQTPSGRGTVIEVTKLYGLSYEDGSGHCLNLDGICTTHDCCDVKFRMFYDTERHTGYAMLTRSE